MNVANCVMKTELVYSDDMSCTYAINREWDDSRKKAIIIELYPTLSADRIGELDSSTCHLLNHMRDFELGGISIVNIYSKVFDYKPGVSELTKDEDNLKYLEELLSKPEIKDMDIIIAWGSSHATHKTTMEMKLSILQMLKKKKLENQVVHIVPEYIDDEAKQGIHPLYLGLHHLREKWSLMPYDLDSEIEMLLRELKVKKDKSHKPITNKKKGKSESVLQNKK